MKGLDCVKKAYRPECKKNPRIKIERYQMPGEEQIVRHGVSAGISLGVVGTIMKLYHDLVTKAHQRLVGKQIEALDKRIDNIEKTCSSRAQNFTEFGKRLATVCNDVKWIKREIVKQNGKDVD